jgi:4-amino-4-deoxy-L-arabinose transferase-like glycosyltransferase
MTRSGRAAGLLAVVGLAAFFRLHDLRDIPPGLFGDEAAEGVVAAAIRHGEQFPVYVEEETKWGSREPLYHYVMAGVFAVFGESPATIRLTSALIGIITVPLAFRLCRLHLGSSVALLTAALLAVSRWHVTMSRLGLRAILTPLWIVLTLLAATFLWRRRSAASALALGVIVGAGFYTYPSYWLMPPFLVACVLWKVARGELRDGRRFASLAAIVVGSALLTVAPLVRYAILKPDYFFGRATRTLTEGAAAAESSYRDGLLKVLLMLHLRGDRNARHNIPGRPMLDPASGFFFVAGLAYMLRSLVHNRGTPQAFAAIVVLWLAFLLPSAVTDSAPHALRALGAVPAVCAIAAIGVHRLGSSLAAAVQALRSKRLEAASTLPRAAAASLPLWTRRMAYVAALLAAGALSYHDYFDDWAKRPGVAVAFSSDVVAFFDRVAELGDGREVRAVPHIADAPQVRFLNRDRKLDIRPLDQSSFVAAPAARDRILIVDTPRLNALVAALYPDAETLARYASEDRPTGRVYLVRREQLRQALTADDRQAVEAALAETHEE